MPLETGNKISDLNPLWPLGSDPKAQGDDHLRLIKSILQSDAVALSDTGSATIVEADALAGWQVMGDMLVQWGFVNTSAAEAVTVDLPQPFKNASYGLSLTTRSSNLSNRTEHQTDRTASSFDVVSFGSNDAQYAAQVSWIAIGEAPDSLKKPKTVQTIGSDPIQEFHDPAGQSSWRIVGNTLECWGVASTGADNPLQVNFGKTFARPPAVVGTALSSSNRNVAVSNATETGCEFYRFVSHLNDASTIGVRWHAIGEWDGN